MKDDDCVRNYLPTGILQRVFPGVDRKIHKVDLRVIRDDKPMTYVTPISQTVVLVEPE